jgi:hypothetical protein
MDPKVIQTQGIVSTPPNNIIRQGQGTGTLPQTVPGFRTPVVAKPASIQRDKVYRRRRLVSGQLRSLSHASAGVHSFLLGAQSIQNAVVINFPSMPDTIELVRKTDYRVTSNFVIPDGIHQYKGTAPLEIPFSFTLHAFDDDEYCEHGALTLLYIASRLHALTLPINRDGAEVVATAPGELESLTSTSDSASEKRAVDTTPSINKIKNPPLFPVACKLDLIYSGSGLPGVSCVGYVQQVNVKLKGPWLRSDVPGVINLPTSAEYSFVFVHRPGHTNRFLSSENEPGLFNLGVQVNAYADDVKNGLYNTVGLLTNTSAIYHGFRT